jgi:hypothetical protein
MGRSLPAAMIEALSALIDQIFSLEQQISDESQKCCGCRRQWSFRE